MALIEQRSEPVTTESIKSRGRLCNTCKAKKEGMFTLDPNGNPLCADCARAMGRPID